MGNTLRLEIVTPDGTAYSEDVDMVTLPGVEGQLGILPGHIPLMTRMVAGPMIVRGRTARIDSSSSAMDSSKSRGNRVGILTELAVAADNVDEAKAEEARQLAEARQRETMSAQEIASVDAALVQALAQRSGKRRQRHGP